MGDLIGWSIFATYVAAGALFARNRVRHWSDVSTLFGGSRIDDGDRTVLALGALGLALIWPVAVAFLAVRGWLFRPVDRELERIERLEADLTEWRAKRYQGSEDERRMASDIVETLEEVLQRRGKR